MRPMRVFGKANNGGHSLRQKFILATPRKNISAGRGGWQVVVHVGE